MTIINFKATVETYQVLQPFKTIEELNANTTAIRNQYGKQLTRLTRKVLDVLHRYSSKYYGVCYLSKSKIARKLEINRSTVIRACNLLEKLGVIAQHSTKRENGDRRQASNVIVFVHQLSVKGAFIENATPKCNTIYTPYNSLNLKDTYDTGKIVSFKKKIDKENLIKQGLINKLPQTLQHALAPFFSVDELYITVGTIYKAKASVDRTMRLEDHQTEYHQAILSIINTYKRGKVQNLQGLVYHSIKSTTRSIWVRERVLSVYEM